MPNFDMITKLVMFKFIIIFYINTEWLNFPIVFWQGVITGRDLNRGSFGLL